MARIIDNPKQLINNTAKEIMLSQGYAKLNIREVAHKCGISVGTVYNYYPTKKELVVEMMSDYWDEFFAAINCVKNERDFYTKIHKLYLELENFIKNFKSIWLTPDLYNNPEYVEGGMNREQIYMEKLELFIEELIISSNIRTKKSTGDTARFILMNIVSLIQMPVIKYNTFEEFLKMILT